MDVENAEGFSPAPWEEFYLAQHFRVHCLLQVETHIPHILIASLKLLLFHRAVGFNPLRVSCWLCSPSQVVRGQGAVLAPLLLLPGAASRCFLVVFWRQFVFGVWLCLHHSETASPGEPGLLWGALRESKTE